MIKRDSYNFAKVNGVFPSETTELDIILSKSSTIFVKRTQLPTMLAWACTVHKVQGLTLPNLAMSLQLDQQRTFGAGQFYIAVNSAIALLKISLVGDLIRDMSNASVSVLLEYDRLRSHSNFFFEPENDSTKFVTLLNIRDLVNNSDNFLADVTI